MKLFLAGLGVGVAIGMMCAPRRGSETRNNISDLAQGSADKARERVRSVSDQIGIARPSTRPTPNWREILTSVGKAESGKSEAVTGTEEKEHVKTPEQKVAPAVPASILDIVNEWPHERLIAIVGIGPVLAHKIISHRPYKSAEELAKSKLLPPSAIEALRRAS